MASQPVLGWGFYLPGEAPGCLGGGRTGSEGLVLSGPAR